MNKKNTIKGVKGYACIHPEGTISIFNRNPVGMMFSVFKDKKSAREQCKLNLTAKKVIPVLITPITKVAKNKVGK